MKLNQRWTGCPLVVVLVGSLSSRTNEVDDAFLKSMRLDREVILLQGPWDGKNRLFDGSSIATLFCLRNRVAP